MGLIVWPVCGSLVGPVGLIGAGCFAPVVCPSCLIGRGLIGAGRLIGWPRVVGPVWPRLRGWAGVDPGLIDWPPVDWAGRVIGLVNPGRVGPRSCPDHAKTGGFCSTFPHKNGSKTDTRPVRTRVNPVVLYAHPVILGPKKPIRPLRISEKKFGRKKMPSLARQNSHFSQQAKILNVFLVVLKFFHQNIWRLPRAFVNPIGNYVSFLLFVARSVGGSGN